MGGGQQERWSGEASNTSVEDTIPVYMRAEANGNGREKKNRTAARYRKNNGSPWTGSRQGCDKSPVVCCRMRSASSRHTVGGPLNPCSNFLPGTPLECDRYHCRVCPGRNGSWKGLPGAYWRPYSGGVGPFEGQRGLEGRRSSILERCAAAFLIPCTGARSSGCGSGMLWRVRRCW